MRTKFMTENDNKKISMKLQRLCMNFSHNSILVHQLKALRAAGKFQDFVLFLKEIRLLIKVNQTRVYRIQVVSLKFPPGGNYGRICSRCVRHS